jgi:hypothetical protein
MLYSPFYCGQLHIFEDKPLENEEITPADSLKCDVKDIDEPWVKGKFQGKIVNTRNIQFYKSKVNRKKERSVDSDEQYILKTTDAQPFIGSLGSDEPATRS